MLKPKPYLRSVHLIQEVDSTEYPFSIPAVAQINDLQFHEDVTFFVGENGSGKSTILEALALGMGFGAQGGTKNLRIDDAGGVSGLHEYLKLKKSDVLP